MDHENENVTKGSQTDDKGDRTPSKTPRSVAFAQKGIKTSEDFANVMSSLMSDLIEGTITPQIGNAVVNAGGKLLQVVEMQYKYANPPHPLTEQPTLNLASGEPTKT